jgi:hypothetical protein
MAYARIVTRYDDSGNITATEVEVGASTEHPDVLDEMATRVSRIYHGLDTADTTETEGREP